MSGRSYQYQYDTSPRKLKPEYEQKQVKKKRPVKKSKPTKQIKTSQKVDVNTKKNVERKQKEKLEIKAKIHLVIKCFIMFAILFLIIFRNSQINEAFATIQNLKSQITTIQKENDQLEVSIQNSINLNNIEQAAKEKLGMQKRTNKQTVYINLSKKDYVEPKSEKVILEEDTSFWIQMIEKIKNIF